MRIQLLVPEIRELLQEGSTKELVSVLQEMHPTDAAAILSALDLPEIVAILSLLPVDLERDVFGYLEPDVQELYVLGAGRERVKAVLLSMLSDDRAEFLDRLDDRVRCQLVPLLPNAAREDLLRRGAFREDQVGAFLSTDFAVLDEKFSARAAIAELRRQAPSKETIYYSYVVDRRGQLKGFVSLRDLILAGDDQPVSEIMKTDLVSVSADADQEQAAQIIRDYDLIALPVVDPQGRLVGIVTHDDAVDIMAEEAAEDLHRLAGVTGDAETHEIHAEPVLAQLRRRAPAICALAVFWVLTALIIRCFESTLGDTNVVTLMPMVMAIGGMVGSQASTLIISALAAGHLRGPLWPVLWKELRVSLLLAILLAIIAFGNAWLVQSAMGSDGGTTGTMHLAWVVAAAMLADVVFAALLGAALPAIINLLRIDPALFSTPAVTAMTDLTGASIYLLTVTALLAAA